MSNDGARGMSPFKNEIDDRERKNVSHPLDKEVR
jgi:hypothetical protein